MFNAIVLLAVFLAGGALGVFAMLLAGIRAEERHMSLRGTPGTRTRSATRRVLGVHVYEPAEPAAARHAARR
ncbi:hypothetical protein SAMN04489712_13824 [Thermomonospora echinospora]|uniref:Uncharacterized protein n=1 Tax=Thermomonospora echinospora TaxID=1992 RepID=A0A1H6E6R8_9ACTN|nr:hypothetical protein [Thermomonospora echinospora]SEG93337.1 hypothetical protein SAMN04489712_13824 [Thermomonospora echinospora]